MIPRAAIYGIGALVAAGVSFVGAVARPDVTPARALDGEALFVTKGCATCHTGPTAASTMGVAPGLAGAPGWAADRVVGMSAEEYLTQSIVQPNAFFAPGFTPNGPMIGMPSLVLSDDEVAAIVDYLLDPEQG